MSDPPPRGNGKDLCKYALEQISLDSMSVMAKIIHVRYWLALFIPRIRKDREVLPC